MNTRLNKKIEQRNKNDDFRPLIYIVITVVATMITCLILMSSKASAIELTQNVNFITSWNTYYNITAGVGNCQYTNTGTTGYAYAPPNGNGACSPLIRILSPSLNGLGFNNDYIFSVPIYIYEYRDREPINNYANSSPMMTITNNGTEIYGQFMGWSSTTFSESAAVIYAYFKFNAGQVSLNSGSTATITPYIAIKENEYLTTGPIGIFSKQNLSVVADFSGVITELQINNQWNNTINSNIQQILQQLREVNQDGGINQLDNAEQRSEEAAQQGQDNANSSGTDNEQASQSILSIIGNVIGAFGTGATDCKINADLGNLDLGNLDFCKDKPSQITNMINAFGSILVVYACYKVAKKIFMLWIKITTYAQGGNLGGNDG